LNLKKIDIRRLSFQQIGGYLLNPGFVGGFAVATLCFGAFSMLGEKESTGASRVHQTVASHSVATASEDPAWLSANRRKGMAMGQDHDHSQPLPSQVQARLAPLRVRLAEDPEDLDARKQAAVLLLNSGSLFEAFEEADQILRVQPEDIDGLYIHGVVRVAMGQGSQARSLLDRVLAQRPDHVAALAARGKALVKMGNIPMAMADWKMGLQAAGGSHAELESLLAVAQRGASAGEILKVAGLPGR